MAEKILVVDDEKEIRDLLSIYLKEDGYQVIAASNGQEAVSLAQAEHPQVILMDVKMPGIDGVETCKRLKEEEIQTPQKAAKRLIETFPKLLAYESGSFLDVRTMD